MFRRLAALVLAALLLAGCAGAGQPSFPADDAVPGWTRSGQSETLSGDALAVSAAGLKDAAGQYALEGALQQRYVKSSGEQIEVQVWKMAEPGEAYGLWSALHSGRGLAGVGNNADSDGTRRLAFWQDRYFAQVLSDQAVTADELQAFGAALARQLPKGGKPPVLVQRLPQSGLEADSVIYFHQVAAIHKGIDLGGENVLGLSAETSGVLAGYRLEGQVFQLLVVAYPAGDDPAVHLSVLQNMGVAGLLVSGTQNGKLAAVFGQQTSDLVVNLLAEVLKP